jgi:hypothetical protein
LIILILQSFFLIDVLNVSDASGKVAFSKSEKIQRKEAAASTSRDWDFKIRESNIKQVDFNFDNHNTAAIPKDLITTI